MPAFFFAKYIWIFILYIFILSRSLEHHLEFTGKNLAML